MSNELRLTFDLCFLTNQNGEVVDKDGNPFDPATDPNWKDKAAFVPVLRDAFQNPSFPPNNPQSIPKTRHVDGEGWRNLDDGQPFSVTFTPRPHWPEEEFPNDVLYSAKPYDALGKK